MHFISFFYRGKKKFEQKKKKILSFAKINSREIFDMTSFAKICSREISKIWPLAKISSPEMSKKFIRENKFSRKLIPLRYSEILSTTKDFLKLKLRSTGDWPWLNTITMLMMDDNSCLHSSYVEEKKSSSDFYSSISTFEYKQRQESQYRFLWLTHG